MKHPKWILSCCLLMWAGVVASQTVVFPNMQRTWSNTGTFLDEGVAVEASWSLSLAQANAIKSYLAAQGFDERLIVAQGMSSSKPVLSCYGLTAAALTNCRATNRRIEVMVNGDF